MIETQYYNGYFCAKCSIIPLIQIIPKINNVNILSFCKCHKQYEDIDIFIKNYYQKDIPIDKISNIDIKPMIQGIKEADISSIVEKFNKTKEEMENHSKEIKEKIINAKISINSENINDYYEKYNLINNKIISLLHQFYDAYKIIKDNKSIILNIYNNSSFNTNYKKAPNDYLLKSYPDPYFKQSIQYYSNEYIISESSIPEQLKCKFYYSPSNTVNCFIEINNKIYASNVRKNPNIILYNLNDINSKLKISFKAHEDNVNWIIKTNNNNLISCGGDGFIKLWPAIPDNIFDEIDQSKKDEKNPNLINYEINPIICHKSELNDMKNIKKMIYIKENSFIALTDNSLLLFNYTINDGNDKENNISLVKKLDIKMIDIIVIEKKNNEKIISGYSNDKLYLINLENLDVSQSLEINGCPEKNCIIQLNENEIMISQKDPKPNLIVVDINNMKIKFTYGNNKYTDYLYKLQDGTVIQSGPEGIWRFMISNYKELPVLYKPFNDTEFDYPYECYEKISCLAELDNGYLMKCVVVGKMEVCNLIFI